MGMVLVGGGGTGPVTRPLLPFSRCATARPLPLSLSAGRVQVVVEHTPEVDALLPVEQRNATLLYIVPRKYTVLAFASRVGAQLAPTQPPPTVLVRAVNGDTPRLPAEMLVSEALRHRVGEAERLSVYVTWQWGWAVRDF